MKHKNKLKLEL